MPTSTTQTRFGDGKTSKIWTRATALDLGTLASLPSNLSALVRLAGKMPTLPGNGSWKMLSPLVSALVLLIALTEPAQGAKQTALDRYVAQADPAYGYKLVSTSRKTGYTTYVLEMTSQSWLTTNEVDRPVWKHWMTLVKPDDVKSTKSLLMIGGGGNDKPAPKDADPNIIAAALATHSVVTELKMVPNQPLTFNGEAKGRVEDSLIAYTWDKFLRTGEERWPARLPMTKSAVRAMDTVTAFCASAEGGGLTVDRFVVAGGSKRGWTTWTTAIVDKRVVAVIPIVIDMLNIVPSFKHHYASYGFYAPAVGDYNATGIMNWQDTPEYKALMKIEEPFEYRDRLTLPKFIINSTGDQFFLPDSSQFYFDALPGIKYLRYVPNSDHSLRGSDAWKTVIACYHSVLNQSPLPRFTWKTRSDGTFEVRTKDRAKEVRLWQASNPKARDFRMETLGPVWSNFMLKETAPAVYSGSVPVPSQGYTAFMVEMTYDQPGSEAPFKFTTGVKVLPDIEPFPGPKAGPAR